MTTAEQIEELAKQVRLEYYRKWRAENKDKVKKHNTNYWIRKATQRLDAEKHGV